MPLRKFMTPMTVPARRATMGCAMYGILQGALILLGGSQRFSSQGLAVARRMPGEQWTWGVWAVTAGVVVAVGLATHRALVRGAGLTLLSIWAGAFGVLAIGSAAASPVVAVTGGPTYLLLAFLIGVLTGYKETPHAAP